MIRLYAVFVGETLWSFLQLAAVFLGIFHCLCSIRTNSRSQMRKVRLVGADIKGYSVTVTHIIIFSNCGEHLLNIGMDLLLQQKTISTQQIQKC